MHHTRFLFLILSLSYCLHASAQVVTETLQSSQKDQVFVTYNLKQSDERVELEFTNIRIKLGDQLNEKHKKASETVAVFFDRIGGYDDIRFSGNITPKAISFSPELAYTPSPDGYFIFDPYQYPSLVFDNAIKETSVVNIPIYLARRVKKHHFEIISSCSTLEIKIENKKQVTPFTAFDEPAPIQPQPIFEEGVTEEEDQALNLVGSIMSRLPSQTKAPISTTLEQEVKNLIDLKSRIKNEDIQSRINETIDAFEAKKQELEEAQRIEIEQQMAIEADNKAFSQCISIEACELYLNSYPEGVHVEEVKAKKAELETADKEKKDKEKKRNIWMIVGGVLMAILIFVGNQVMQAIRTKRTQQNMLKMQTDAVNQAKNAAQGAIRKETNQVVNQVQQKGKNAVRDAVGGATQPKGKGNNGRISI